MKRISLLFVVLVMLTVMVSAEAGNDTIFVHLKTGLKKDDAQICVAYNVVWTALHEGKNVNVLIDADAVNTFRIRRGGKDSIEKFALPERLRESLATQLNIPLESIPKNYGEYLDRLKNDGANFYINRAMTILAGHGTPDDPLEKISAKFFIPVTLLEMLQIRSEANYYLVY